MTKFKPFLLLIAVLWFVAPTALALDTSEVWIKVFDDEGNPIRGAKVVLVNTTSSAARYEVKTNKRGEAYIPNLLYYSPGEWEVSVEAEGFVPHKMKVESRRANRTLVGEPYETGLAPNRPAVVRIPGLGEARLEFVLISEAKVAQRRQEEAAAAEAAARAKQEAAMAKDPWAMAQARVAERDLEGSLPWFEKAVAAAPEDAERRLLYAKVLYNLERDEAARAQAEEVLKLDPERPGVHLLLARIALRGGDEAGALQHLEAELQRSPDDLQVLKLLAHVAEQSGDSGRAIEINRRIVTLAPEDVEAWLALGDLYAARGDSAAAEEAFSKVVELDPENAHKTFFNIGVLIESNKDRSPAEDRRAVEAYRKAIQVKPDYVEAHRRLAYALLRIGDLAGARREFQKVLELDPEAEDAAEIRQWIQRLPAAKSSALVGADQILHAAA